jgi:hypothetical protein
MSRVPSLPLGEGEATGRIGRALLVRGRSLGVALPPPEAFGLPPLEKPSFELRLTGTPLEVHGELAAVYAIGKMSVGTGDVDPARDVVAEEAALALVKAAGFVATDRGLVAAEEDAVKLWREGLASLRASASPRFEVLAVESISRTRIGPDIDLDIRVKQSAGWLETELEFRAGALKVEIKQMHDVLLAKSRWIVLSDGSLAKIADEVAALVGEVSSLGANAFGPRTAPHQFGRIARWIELADRPGARVQVQVDPVAEALRVRLRDLAKTPQPRLPSQLEATLRPYQLVGVAWLQLG